MEPWIQPTTAPRQPDVADDEQSVDQEVRVERGWMEPQPGPSEAPALEPRSSVATTGFTAAVVIGYLFLALFMGPLLLLHAYGS